MPKFKHDPETDTVTMPATYWRALATTKQIGYAQDGKIRYIEPRNVLMNSISDALLRDVVKWDQADIDELFALIEAPGSGAPIVDPAKRKADDGLELTPLDLLKMAVDYTEAKGFADSHTDVVQWLVSFACDARGVLAGKKR